MDVQLRNAIFQRLEAVSAITVLADVFVGRLPLDPKNLTNKLGLVIRENASPDVSGAHGAAVDVHVEVKIFGWGNGLEENARIVAQLVDETLLKGFVFADDSVTRKLRAVTGWQDIEEQHVDLIHKQNVYVTRYWSQQRITAVTT